MRLAEPEHGLLAHRSIAIRARYLDEQRHALIFGKLAEREDCTFLDLGLRVVLDGRAYATCPLRSGQLMVLHHEVARTS